jgi:hypothetical protein
MVRLGVFLAVIGFGSIGFHFTDYQFRILMWAEPMQPGIGAVVGVVGLVLIGVSLARKKNVAQPAPAPQLYGGQFPQQPAAPQLPGQYPQPQAQHPQGPAQYPQAQYPQQP